jgi:hypothetical protein
MLRMGALAEALASPAPRVSKAVNLAALTPAQQVELAALLELVIGTLARP